jgi:hypothetical protein
MDFQPARTPAVNTSVGAAGLVAAAVVQPEIPPAVAKRIAKAVESSRSEGTRRTYAAGWRRFCAWCDREGHVALPAHPVTVAAYLVDAADTRTETGERAYAVATFGTWIAAINHQHRTTGHLSPSAHELVTATLSGIRTSRSSSRPREDGVVGGPTKSSNAVIRRSCCSGSPAHSAAANSRSSSVGTLPYTGTTACTSGYGSRRPTKRAGEQ